MTEVVTTLAAWRNAAESVRRRGDVAGLVPTMGALHAGHRSLIERARDDGTTPFVTIFVNPRQFDDPNDLANYPATLDDDLALCEAAGAAFVIAPPVQEMWPSWPQPTATTVSVTGVADRWEGAGRPGHFDGVASVVAKLFTVHGPGVAYFGEKDFQQLAVVRRLTSDLGIDVRIVGCPIVRDVDGVALSSRNARLTESGREQAARLSAVLREAETSNSSVRELEVLLRARLAGLDVAYAAIVQPDTLEPCAADFAGAARVLLAVRIDDVRLIDNAAVSVNPEKMGHASRD